MTKRLFVLTSAMGIVLSAMLIGLAFLVTTKEEPTSPETPSVKNEESTKLCVPREERCCEEFCCEIPHEEKDYGPEVVIGIDKNALLNELGIEPGQSGADPWGWSVSNTKRGERDLGTFRIAICATKEQAGDLYMLNLRYHPVGPLANLPEKFHIGDYCAIWPSNVLFIRDNVVVAISWRGNTRPDFALLARVDKLLQSPSAMVARGHFDEEPALNLPEKAIVVAGEERSVPIKWAGFGDRDPSWYVAAEGQEHNQLLPGFVQVTNGIVIQMPRDAPRREYRLNVCAVSEHLLFAAGTMKVVVQPPDQPSLVTGIDEGVLFNNLRIHPASRETGEKGWLFSESKATGGRVSRFSVAVCGSRQAALAIYNRTRMSIEPLPSPLSGEKDVILFGDVCTAGPSRVIFVRDNVFADIGWYEGVDVEVLNRLDNVLRDSLNKVTRGQFTEVPELKGLPETLTMKAGEVREFPLVWAGLGTNPPVFYVTSPAGMANQVEGGKLRLKVSPDASGAARLPVEVCGLGEWLVFVRATIYIDIQPAPGQSRQ